MKPYNIIFVCTGNACRSPFAETIMKKLLPKIRNYHPIHD